MQKLIDWLKSLDPKKRKQLILAAILVGFLFGSKKQAGRFLPQVN
jgi:hypothetical protein